MFQEIYFAPREAPIKTFTDVAANPVFALNVKELTYDGRLFLPELGHGASYWAAFCPRMLKKFDTYEDYMRNPKDPDFTHQVYQDSIWNVEKLRAGENMKRIVNDDCEEFCINVADNFERYEHLLDQQERILKDGTDFKTLCNGLTSFRNINKIGALVDFDHCSNYRYYVNNTHGRCDESDHCYTSRSKLKFGLTVPPSK